MQVFCLLESHSSLHYLLIDNSEVSQHVLLLSQSFSNEFLLVVETRLDSSEGIFAVPLVVCELELLWADLRLL